MHVRIRKVSIYGSAKAIEVAKTELEQHLPKRLFEENEPAARRIIQSLTDDHNIKATILWDGNRVWSKKRILRDFRMIMRHGMNALTDYLYEFFHLCCGSIAHYNKQGWICEYPDIEALRSFFERNEFGTNVLAHQPGWASDRIEIIREVDQLLKIKETI
jgi:hypothetical protein